MLVKALVIRLCILIWLIGIVFCLVDDDDEVEDVWIGAEDFENNDFPGAVVDSVSYIVPDQNVVKSSRQDQEDVEIYLNPGPMLAPDIIQNKFVDSRISLSNIDEVFQKTGKISQDRDSEGSNNLGDSEQIASDDNTDNNNSLLSGLAFALDLDLNEVYSNSSLMSKFNEWKHSDSMHFQEGSCQKRFDGAVGAFNMSFKEDCIIQITSPKEDSRLILTCSPIKLGNCSKFNDSLAVNMMGDETFKQNSFLFCGEDANIRAISIKNKLAIRVKRTPEIAGSTFCTFHSREHREYVPSSSSSSCGRLGRSGKIIGGRRVPPGLFPWAVQLDITRTDGSQTGCTASIISPSYLLTAAHCMKRAELVSAFMGGTDRHDIIGTEILIQAEKYILHKKWSSRTLVADIALVKLTQPIEYSEDISPVCLPEGRLLIDDLSGRRGVAIGWGRTETKKKAPRRLYRIKLPMLSDSRCRKIYRRFYIPKVMICTDSQKDAAICYGMKRNSLQTFSSFIFMIIMLQLLWDSRFDKKCAD